MNNFLTSAATLLSILTPVAPALGSWEQGVSAFQAGRYEDAVDEFRSLVEVQPEAPQGHYMLGLSLLRTNGAAAAQAPLARAVELEPGDASYRLLLAQTQLGLRRPDDALTTLAAQDAAAVPDSRRPSFSRLLAKVAAASTPGDRSLAVVERALTFDADSRPLWLASASIARDLGRTQRAFDAYATAYGLDPEEVELGRQTVRFAFAAARDHRQEERRSWYERASQVAVAVAAAAPTAEHLLLAGESLLGAKDTRGARTWFERAADADAADPWPRFYLARCVSEEPEAALDHLRDALERSPEADLTAQIHTARGAALRRLERFAEAGEAYRLAGDGAKVAEMEKLAEIQAGNDRWAAEKRRCEAQRSAVEAQLKDNEFLAGTAAWRELVKDAEAALASCRPYLDEAD